MCYESRRTGFGMGLDDSYNMMVVATPVPRMKEATHLNQFPYNYPIRTQFVFISKLRYSIILHVPYATISKIA